MTARLASLLFAASAALYAAALAATKGAPHR